jgi:hypothetical protein
LVRNPAHFPKLGPGQVLSRNRTSSSREPAKQGDLNLDAKDRHITKWTKTTTTERQGWAPPKKTTSVTKPTNGFLTRFWQHLHDHDGEDGRGLVHARQV